MQHIVIDPRGALPTAVQAFVVPDTREAIELAVDALIERLDGFDQPSDPDAPDFSIACDGYAGSPEDAEPDEDVERAAWIERVDQSKPAFTHEAGHHKSHEDAEDDDGGGGCTDDDPGFNKHERALANILGRQMFGPGAGCDINGDCELNGDETDHSFCD